MESTNGSHPRWYSDWLLMSEDAAFGSNNNGSGNGEVATTANLNTILSWLVDGIDVVNDMEQDSSQLSSPEIPLPGQTCSNETAPPRPQTILLAQHKSGKQGQVTAKDSTAPPLSSASTPNTLTRFVASAPPTPRGKRQAIEVLDSQASAKRTCIEEASEVGGNDGDSGRDVWPNSNESGQNAPIFPGERIGLTMGGEGPWSCVRLGCSTIIPNSGTVAGKYDIQHHLYEHYRKNYALRNIAITTLNDLIKQLHEDNEEELHEVLSIVSEDDRQAERDRVPQGDGASSHPISRHGEVPREGPQRESKEWEEESQSEREAQEGELGKIKEVAILMAR
ncbi:hypothetical protein HOY80DRAFT_1106736 [Tuber brumale]|nr:hypothetical protein HOY80DRAFT_1106736 [Tuber brumale]